MSASHGSAFQFEIDTQVDEYASIPVEPPQTQAFGVKTLGEQQLRRYADALILVVFG